MTTPERKVHFVSLGCPKNRVDSEVMLGVALGQGYRLTQEAREAEVIVVNTCGFIDAAKKESIDTILEMASLKHEGACQRLIVAGCLSQRYPDELARELPEVDHFLGSSDMLKIGAALRDGAPRMMVGHPAEWVVAASDPRALSSSPGSAYVKIAEGCNRSCSFCVIPALRGKQRSRAIDDVVREVERLVDGGVREINLVSQDTVAYGRDRGEGDLATLVARVAETPGLRWLRLFYLYPEALSPALVELLAHHPRVLPYVDMPLQHAADGMLRRMRRGHGGARLRRLVEQLRGTIDDLTFRTAFIVGHPGETAEEFDELCQFIAWAEFEHIGVFKYSDEEGSHSHDLDGKVAPLVVANRWRKIMALGRKIARRKNAALVGRRLEVLVEGTSDEHEHVVMGRHRGQAPEIDGQVYLSTSHGPDALPRPGTLSFVTVSQASDFDLVGELEADDVSDDAPHGRRRVSLRVLPRA
jgi:ribosomal protein S12 methylthiotransferase